MVTRFSFEESQQRDGERYPEVLSNDAPEVATHFSDQPEVVSEQDNHKYMHTAHYPAIQSSHATTPGSAYNGPYSGIEVVESPSSSNRKCCGLSRKTFIIILVVVVVLVIGAVVGGVVGGVVANNSESSGSGSAESSDTASPGGGDDNDDDGDSPIDPSEPLEAADRMVAASVSATSEIADFQLFYQDLDTTDILYRLFWDDEAQSEQRLHLDIPPNQGTPLAAVANKPNNNDFFRVNLFYMSTDNSSDSNPLIVRARLECEMNAESCDLLANPVISEDSRQAHNESSLAALWLRESSRLRVYFQAEDDDVHVLSSDDEDEEGSDSWGTQRIGGPAREGSDLVAFQTETSSSLNVAFIAEETSRLRRYEYTDRFGAQGAQRVDDSPGSSWRPSARLAAAYVPTAKNSRIYYSAEGVQEIMSYWRESDADEDEEWNTHQARNWRNVRVSGGFAAIGWARECRLAFYDGSEESWGVLNQSNATWSGPFWL